MKNHLSMLGSIGAGALLSPDGMLSWLGSTRSGELLTVVLVLYVVSSEFQTRNSTDIAYREISPLLVLPVMSLSHASAHSRTTSMAYFLFLHSPEKANWFSGFPSGIL